jgi:hypothetical protein
VSAQNQGSDVLADLIREVSRPEDFHRQIARSFAETDKAAGRPVRVSTAVIRKRQWATTEILPD